MASHFDDKTLMAKSRRSISRIISDRGPAAYFHGRTQILHDFEDLLGRTKKGVNGTTFLIQGAPGVGKTALLDQCGKLACGKGWHVAKIKTDALWDKGKMLRSLGFGEMAGIDSVSLSLLEAFKAEVSLSKPARSTTNLNVDEKRKRKPLLLVLDEAQRLSKATALSKTQFDEVGDLLEAIHNGELNKPVILLVAGLGTTSKAFRSLGISRFRGGCFVELGALDKGAERAVIQDWLVKEGEAKGNPAEWIDAIAQKTHGWPQHITAYAETAVKQIQKDKGKMTPAGLIVVYKLGEEGREAYYKQRAEDISRKERCSLARLMKNVATQDGLDQEDIEAALSQEYGPDKAQDLFNRALDRGILHSQDGIYTIPIPSMRNWLKEKYAPEKIVFSQQSQISEKL
ncbi:MAG: ATP-binding protein [Bacteroidetes bacterium]|nr:ATP-binding protein [Bacteroidota bacterium]